MGGPRIWWLSDGEMEEATNGFSEENLIGEFQFGKVYRGKFMRKELTVKVWQEDEGSMYKILPGDMRSRMREELTLHEDFRDYRCYNKEIKSHPNIAFLFGAARTGKHLATLYELKALDSLHNLLLKDNLTWAQRIKIALGSACAIEFFHSEDPPYLIRNICAQHIMLDQEHNPILYDFSMISGGVLTDRRNLPNEYVDGCHGYIDPIWARPGKWSTECDVFSYGVLLLELITKKVYTKEDYFSHEFSVYEWAKIEYKQQNSSFTTLRKSKASLVHYSLESEPNFYASDGIKITKLALMCVRSDPHERPTMKQIVKKLQNLRIFRHHATILGIDQMSSSDVSSTKIQKISGKKIDPPLILEYLDTKSRLFRKGFSHQTHQKILKWFQEISHFSEAGRQSSEKECSMIEVFSYEALGILTDGFSKENFIGKFQFGKLFHGKINGRKVTVKIWERPKIYNVGREDLEQKLRDELVLLQDPRLFAHPRVVNLIGYCQEGGNFGVVYDLESLDTLYNLVPKDCFTWLERMKVAIEFARLLKFLHVGDSQHLPYIVCNIDAEHIMLDQDHNPNLIDFGQFTGGILPDRRFPNFFFVRGSYGYTCTDYSIKGWSTKCDVFSYGVVLLNLISKRLCTEDDMENERPTVYKWALDGYKTHMASAGSSKFCLAHPSLEADPGFDFTDAHKVTELALQCVQRNRQDRPTMEQAVKSLLNLRAARGYKHKLGVKKRAPASN